MKKMISVMAISSLLVNSAFAESISSIMTKHTELVQTQGVELATSQTMQSILDNNISQQDMTNYLRSELSPRDFKKAQEKIQKGEINSVAFELSKGANFSGLSCYNMGPIAVISGIVAVVTGIVYLHAWSKPDELREQALDLRVPLKYDGSADEQAILEIQLEIDALKAQGVADSSYFITDRQAEIARLQLLMEQDQRHLVTENEERLLEADKKERKATKEEDNQKIRLITTAAAAAITGTYMLKCD